EACNRTNWDACGPNDTYANHSRLKGLRYPTATTLPTTRLVNYDYTGTLNNAISRLNALKGTETPTPTTFEQYAYLGLGTLAQRTHVQGANEIGLTYLQQAGDPAPCTPCDGGDKYRGLDRFGRVAEQHWFKTNDLPNPRDRFQYGYDRNGNRVYRENLVRPT